MRQLKFPCFGTKKGNFMDRDPNVFDLPASAEKKPREPIRVSLGTFILCLLLAGLMVFMSTYVACSLQAKQQVHTALANAAEFDKLLELSELYDKYYYYETDEGFADELAPMFGAAVGDPYYSYYTKDEWFDSYSASMGNATGIGVYITMQEEGYIHVTRVMRDSPAEAAGLLQGDVITAVDGKDVLVVGYEAATNLVYGEKGSDVTFDILRNGQKMQITVTRGTYDPQTVFAEIVTMHDGTKLGYIQILQFELTTAKQFTTAVKEMTALGVAGLCFDVRSNPGGDLVAVKEILDFLLPEGPIVHIVGVREEENHTYTSDANEVDLPMVVLTDGHTASAAELFTSALRDYEKAQSVGTKTFGKGCGQEGMTLSDGSVAFITTFLYNPPFSENYDGVGIPADIEVELPEQFSNMSLLLVPHEEDTQLQKALSVLLEKTAADNT